MKATSFKTGHFVARKLELSKSVQTFEKENKSNVVFARKVNNRKSGKFTGKHYKPEVGSAEKRPQTKIVFIETKLLNGSLGKVIKKFLGCNFAG